MSFVYYKELKSGKIVAKFWKCDTNSKVWRNTKKYKRFTSDKNIPLDVKPKPKPPPSSFTISSPDGTPYQITVSDKGQLKANKVK